MLCNPGLNISVCFQSIFETGVSNKRWVNCHCRKVTCTKTKRPKRISVRTFLVFLCTFQLLNMGPRSLYLLLAYMCRKNDVLVFRSLPVEYNSVHVLESVIIISIERCVVFWRIFVGTFFWEIFSYRSHV